MITDTTRTVTTPMPPRPIQGTAMAPPAIIISARRFLLAAVEVAEVQLVHELVVLVPRRRIEVAGERVRVGALEEDAPAAVAVEDGVVPRIVEAIAIVR